MTQAMDSRSASTRAARTRLTRHPVALEAARVVESIVGARCDVVVFDSERAFVVASSDSTFTLKPRRLTAAERELQHGDAEVTHQNGIVAARFDDADGNAIGALTAWAAEGAMPDAAWAGFARQIMAVLAESTIDDDVFRTTLNGMRDAVFVIEPDMSIRWCNDAVGSLLGRTANEVMRMSAFDLLHPDDVALAADAISRAQQGLEQWRVRIHLLSSTDEWVPVEVTGLDHSGDDRIGGLVLSLRYANYARELETTVDRVERMSRAIVSGLRDAIVATDEFGAVTVVNDVARTMFGIGPDVTASSLTLEDFELLDHEGRRQPLELDPQGHTRIEACVISPERGLRYARVASQRVEDESGRFVGTVVAFHDVTGERRAQEELKQQALHDQLTGLANRRQLNARLEEIAHLSEPVDVAALFIDLDGFKLVNDNHGHRVGDELIGVAADRLAEQLRGADLLVRQGGDEFVALLVDIASIDTAVTIAERCLEELAKPYFIRKNRFDVSASIGVAITQSPMADSGALLQQADIAMYAAKAGGRNRVQRFDAALAEAVSLESRQRRLLRAALDDDRLVMHFQPLVDSASGEIIGHEALARVQTEQGRLLTPDGFMDAIANGSLMWELDCQAFARSCHAAALLNRCSPSELRYMACNFSTVSLSHPDVLTMIDATIEAAGVAPQQICIEMTESAAFESGAHAVNVLSQLAERGFTLALDDFGTGYSSLSHLRDLPIQIVKVDRSFVTKLGEKTAERAITEAIATVARELDLNLIAEGVETQEHLDHVRELGVETVQGWYYAPARPLTDCAEALGAVSASD